MFNLSFFNINNITSLSQWHAPRRSLITRSVAMLISLCFLVPTISWAFDIKTYENDGSAKTRLFGPHDKRLAAEYRIPPNLGKTVEAGFAPGDLTFILVQDLHCNYEIQSNIRSMLNHLMGRHSELKLVAVEGATGIIPTMELALLPDSAIKRAVADYFMREGKLTGADCLAICDSPAIELFGAEDPQLYDESIELIQDFGTEENRGLILELLDQLELLENQRYNRELLAFEQRHRAFMRGDLDVEAYHHHLIREARGLKITLLPPALLFRGGGRLDFHDQETQDRYLENQIYGRLARTANEKRLLRHRQFVEIVERIVSVAASRKDILAYQKQTREISLPGVLKLLQLLPEESRYTAEEEIEALEEAVGKALKFYEMAEQRNHALLENTARRARDRGENRVILVTGGFHTPAIIELIRNRGCSYVSLRPHMEKAGLADNYFDLLRYPDQPTELERVMAQLEAGVSAIPPVNHLGLPGFRALFVSAMSFMQEAVTRIQAHKSSTLEWGNLSLKRIKNNLIQITPQGANSMILRLSRKDMKILQGDAARTAGQTSVLASSNVRILSMGLLGMGLIALVLSSFLPIVAAPVAAAAAGIGLAWLGIWWTAAHFKTLVQLPQTNPALFKRAIVLSAILLPLTLLAFATGTVSAEAINTLGVGTPAPNIFLQGITASAQQVLSLPIFQELTVYAHDAAAIPGRLSDLLTYLNTMVISSIGNIGLGLFAGMLFLVGQVSTAAHKKPDTKEPTFRNLYGTTPDDLFAQELKEKIRKSTEALLGNIVERWEDLPVEGYDDIVRRVDMARMRELLKKLGLGNLESRLARIISFKPEDLQAITLATVDILPEVIDNLVRLAVSVVVVRPKKGLFQSRNAAEDYDPHALLERFRNQWEEGMNKWDHSLSSMTPENAAMLEFYTSQEVVPIVEKGMPAIANMSAEQKQALGLNIMRHLAPFHEAAHAAVHELIYAIPMPSGETGINWMTYFSQLLKQNPGVFIVKGMLKAIGGNDEELMPWQYFIETWCDKCALFLLKKSLEEGFLDDPEARQIVELFAEELSPEEEQAFEQFKNHLEKRGRNILSFPVTAKIPETALYKASRSLAASQIPAGPLKLNINFSFINSLFFAVLGGTIMAWLVHSYLLGFFAAGTYLIYRIIQIGYFEALGRIKPEALERNLKEWNTADGSYGNTWIKRNSWILSRCTEYSYDKSNLELRPKEGNIIQQFFWRGFAPLYIEDQKIYIHPIFLLLPRVMAEAYLIHELRHFKDLGEHPFWPKWRFELSAKIASARALQNIFKINSMRSLGLNPDAIGLIPNPDETGSAEVPKGITPEYDMGAGVVDDIPALPQTIQTGKAQTPHFGAKTVSFGLNLRTSGKPKLVQPILPDEEIMEETKFDLVIPYIETTNAGDLKSVLKKESSGQRAMASLVRAGTEGGEITAASSTPAAPSSPSAPAAPITPAIQPATPSTPAALGAANEALAFSRAEGLLPGIFQRWLVDPQPPPHVYTNDAALANALNVLVDLQANQDDTAAAENWNKFQNAVQITTLSMFKKTGLLIGLPNEIKNGVVVLTPSRGDYPVQVVQLSNGQTAVPADLTAIDMNAMNEGTRDSREVQEVIIMSEALKPGLINGKDMDNYILLTPAQAQKYQALLGKLYLPQPVQGLVNIENTALLQSVIIGSMVSGLQGLFLAGQEYMDDSTRGNIAEQFSGMISLLGAGNYPAVSSLVPNLESQIRQALEQVLRTGTLSAQIAADLRAQTQAAEQMYGHLQDLRGLCLTGQGREQLQQLLAEQQNLAQQAFKQGAEAVPLVFDLKARAIVKQVDQVLKKGPIVVYSDVGWGLKFSDVSLRSLATTAGEMGVSPISLGSVDNMLNEAGIIEGLEDIVNKQLRIETPGKSALEDLVKRNLTTEQYMAVVDDLSSLNRVLVLGRGEDRHGTPWKGVKTFLESVFYFKQDTRTAAEREADSVGKRLPELETTKFEESSGLVRTFSMVVLGLAAGRLILRALGKLGRRISLEEEFKPQRLPIFQVMTHPSFIKALRLMARIITGNVGDKAGKDPLLHQQLADLQRLTDEGIKLEDLKSKPSEIPDSLKVSLNLLLWIKASLGKLPLFNAFLRWRKIDMDSLQPELLRLVNEFIKMESVSWHFAKYAYMMHQAEMREEGLDTRLFKNLTISREEAGEVLSASRAEQATLLLKTALSEKDQARIMELDRLIADMMFARRYQMALQQMDTKYSSYLLVKMIHMLLGELDRKDVGEAYRTGVLEVLSLLGPGNQETIQIRTEAGLRVINIPAELLEKKFLLAQMLFNKHYDFLYMDGEAIPMPAPGKILQAIWAA